MLLTFPPFDEVGLLDFSRPAIFLLIAAHVNGGTAIRG
jgi:hypothetical protein